MKPTREIRELVKMLIKQGRAGEKPFGVSLAVWLEEIRKQDGQETLPASDTAQRKEH